MIEWLVLSAVGDRAEKCAARMTEILNGLTTTGWSVCRIDPMRAKSTVGGSYFQTVIARKVVEK